RLSDLRAAAARLECGRFRRSPAARARAARPRQRAWDELSKRFHHVLVDEFQDTNLVQYRLGPQLARPHPQLCVGGDDGQLIYSWRGADVRNMLDFQRDYPDARVIRLERNYRSTQIILDAANHLVARNHGRLGKTLYTEQPAGEPILLYEAETERDEARFVAR